MVHTCDPVTLALGNVEMDGFLGRTGQPGGIIMKLHTNASKTTQVDGFFGMINLRLPQTYAHICAHQLYIHAY